MATQLPRYPLDPTGVNPDNLVIGEEHTLPNRTIRALAPLYGAFFTESVVVRDRSNNQVLQKNIQYTSTELYEFPTGRWGKEICGIILITDQNVSNNVEIDYQALGGEYSTNVDAIVSMFNEAMLERPVSWPNILGAPDEFNPAAHFHDVGDIYGFEYVVNALERLRSAVLVGDAASHDEILKYVDRQDTDIRTEADAILIQLNDHAANHANPHVVTKAQVGLSDVENYPIATTTQAQNGTGNAYMTPSLVKMSITPELVPFQSHLVNVSNPHSTTKSQVGLSNVENYPIASQAEAEAGTSNTVYITPLRVSQAITSLALGALTAHVSRVDNPHAVTASQVGLSSVQNYPIASQAEAQAGSSNVTYTTPLRVSQAITTLALGPLNSHTARTDNPHSTTAAQVGLGSVQNYGIAAIADAQAGISNILYMTPLRVSQAISTLALGPLNTHTARVDNPHSTTAAQVGLGNVVNLPLANTSEAQAGTSHVLYMTPLLTAQAISAQAITPLNTHIARTDNPHNTTASQVGLSLVQNYTIATQVEAQNGTSNTTYMTPLRVSQAISTLALTPLNSHTARTDNPHGVTKAQVGLGSVLNYTTASQAEAQAGSSDTLYMTPLRTAQAISTQVGSSLSTHISRTDNPHSTTAAQVGLGNVSNYAVATSGEALAGSSNTTYMTPALTQARVAAHATSGDHDSRYALINSNVSASVRESGGTFQAFIGGSWRVVWPPQWQ